tara:strand:- start:6785 stop:8773 length:1989 start_codon:yes stop_codon:yes gene_type:complete
LLTSVGFNGNKMMSIGQMKIGSSINNEIDLNELFFSLWAYKLLILITVIISLSFSVHRIQNIKTVYKSSAIFKIFDEADTLNFGGASLLANFTGISTSGSKNSILPEEMVKGRVFVERINRKLDFESDLYFNQFTLNKSKDSTWKTILKRNLGYQIDIPLDQKEVIWQGIVNRYSQNVAVQISASGIITITVTHQDANRAAVIANYIMKTILDDKINKINKQMNDQLIYLSNTMANSLSDLEATQSKLKTFAIENSALPLESFSAGSIQLDFLREEFKRAMELYNAAFELEKILQKKEISNADYLNLSNEFPIVDQVEFRRILGQNEIVSSWSWPNRNVVLAVLDTLFERKERLENEINASQKDVDRSGRTLEIYSKLKREEKTAEAMYTVIMEQVKAQSMSAGYKHNSSIIYEYAAPSISPSGSNNSLILLFGAVLGLFFGSLLSLVVSANRKVFYTKKSIVEQSKANFIANYKSIMFLRKKKLKELKSTINKSLPVFRDLIVEIHSQSANFVVVSSLATKIKSHELAKIMSSIMQNETIKIATINFSHSGRMQSDNLGTEIIGDFQLLERENNISVLTLKDDLEPMSYVSQRDFSASLQLLSETFDIIFVCADNIDALSLVRAIKIENIFHIMLTRIKHTKRKNLFQISMVKSIQGLLYE